LRALFFVACWLWTGFVMAGQAVPLDLHQSQAVSIPAGGTLTIRGAVRSSHDGSVIDAATTMRGAGAATASGGLLDFEAGGLRLVGQNQENHEYQFASAGQGDGCTMAGLPSPCLIPRLLPLAQERLLVVADFSASLTGVLSMDAPESPVTWRSRWPLGLLAGLGVATLMGLRIRRRAQTSLYRDAQHLMHRLQKRLRKGDPVHQRLLLPLHALVDGARRLEDERKRGLAEGWPGEAARAEASLKSIVSSLEALHRTLDSSTRIERACLDTRLLDELDQGMAAATSAIKELRGCPTVKPGEKLRLLGG
jgi:hypothetical protein